MSRKRVAVLISGRGSNMAALIEAAKDKNYPAEIVLVISNRPDAGGLLVARAAAIATEVVDHTEFGKDRAGFERAVQAILEKERIDLVCLAGFMRLLTVDFVKKWHSEYSTFTLLCCRHLRVSILTSAHSKPGPNFMAPQCIS